jgi:hypothetical protein
MKLPFSWRRSNQDHQPSVALAQAGDAIALAQVKDHVAINPLVDQWAEVVLRFSNLEMLTGNQNVIIFGTSAMGRQAVMRRIANLINVRFNAEHHAGLYVSISDKVSASTVYTFTSVDALYRDLITAPFRWATQQLHVKEDREFQKTTSQLEALLNVPVAKLDVLAVRELVSRWLDRMGIQYFSLILDDLSTLSPEFIPILLQMLLDTYPRGGRVSFKLGGEKQTVRLLERSKNNMLGMQLSHDILMGLDLEQVLHSPDVQASQFDPRQVFLLDRLQKIAPELAAQLTATPDPAWGTLFEPAEAWSGLFGLSDDNIELMEAALGALLLTRASAPEGKLNPERVEQAMNQAMIHAGLRKPAPQQG